jgi:hypothetical protein
MELFGKCPPMEKSSIIDFDRAIFRLKNKVIFSDDFKDGNDAATQYNFGPLRDITSLK